MFTNGVLTQSAKTWIGKRGIPGGKHCVSHSDLKTPPVPEARPAGDGKPGLPTPGGKTKVFHVLPPRALTSNMFLMRCKRSAQSME